jgi:hypothetical protein
MSMTRFLLVIAGLFITLAGVVFALQGVGVIGGSFMSGTTTWAVTGPIIALAGLALVALGLRRPRRLAVSGPHHAADTGRTPGVVPGSEVKTPLSIRPNPNA